MAFGYDPFTSKQSLGDFLSGIRDPAMELGRADNTIDPQTKLTMQNYLDYIRSSTPPQVPEFTDKTGLSSNLDKRQDQFLIDSHTAELQSRINLLPEDYDFPGATTSSDALNRLIEIQARVEKAGQEFERQKAKDIGLLDLQDQYLKLLQIPGSTEFQSNVDRLASMETQIAAKQKEVANYINRDNKGNIGGELAPVFTDASALISKWDARVKELKLQEQQAIQGLHVGDNFNVDGTPKTYAEKLAGKEAAKAQLALGGKDKIIQLGSLLGVPDSEVVSRYIANQIPTPILSMFNKEVSTGKPTALDDAIFIYGTEGANAVIDRASRQNSSIDSKTLKSLVNEVNNKSKLDEITNGMIEEYKTKNKLVGTKLDKNTKAEIETKAKYELYKITYGTYINELKNTAIKPDKFSIANAPGINNDYKLAAEFLLNSFPDAFTYTNDVNKLADAAKLAKVKHEELRKLNPEHVPPFDQVIQLMYNRMIESINSDYAPLGIKVIDRSDPAIQNLQMQLLTGSINSNDKGVLGHTSDALFGLLSQLWNSR